MREILFKAKSISNGEWVEGAYLHQTDYYGEKCDKHYIIDGTETDMEGYGEHYLVDENTICQYTGLKDKYKRKIFENDLISFLDVSQYDNGYAEYYCLGQVLWDEETASFEVTERLSCESYEALDGDCEIIGNIFDNPELIGGGE